MRNKELGAVVKLRDLGCVGIAVTWNFASHFHIISLATHDGGGCYEMYCIYDMTISREQRCIDVTRYLILLKTNIKQ